MPDRILKDIFLTDPLVSGLKCRSQNLLIRLLLMADDHGRSEAHPRVLLGRLYPHEPDVRESDLSASLRELEGTGLVRLYEVEAQPYLQVKCWGRFVRVPNSAKHSKCPGPSDQLGLPMVVDAVNTRAPPTPSTSTNTSTKTRSVDGLAEAGRSAGWPCLDEVKAHAAAIGLPLWVAEAFFLEFEAVGWRLKGQEIVNWQALLRMKRTFWEADGRPMQPKGNYGNNSRGRIKVSRNAGTANEGGSEQYRLRSAL